MSNASSNQSLFRDGAGYEEMYPSSYRDQDDLSERSPSAFSSSSKNEDTEVAEPEEGSDDGEDQRVKYVVGADGLREFIMLPEWTMNAFMCHTSTPLGPTTKSHITSPSVYPISQKSVTMKG